MILQLPDEIVEDGWTYLNQEMNVSVMNKKGRLIFDCANEDKPADALSLQLPCKMVVRGFDVNRPNITFNQHCCF